MEVLIQLLERKNSCFKNFHQICEGFLDEIAVGNTENLEDFQRKRQALILALDKIEKDVNERLQFLGESSKVVDKQPSDKMRTKINFILREKDSMVNAILDLDLQILGHIDRIKNDTIQKLQALQTNKKSIGAYKSPLDQIENAEEAKAINKEV